ncbi:MAG: hypothetical protein RSG96_08715, partial [Clostridia bacterium]
LEELDQAGMLLDLSQSDYLASRKSFEAAEGGREWCLGMPNGIFNTDNRLIGVPCHPWDVWSGTDQAQVLIINAKSKYIDDAIRYVEHHIKGMEDIVFSPDEETTDRICLEYSTALWEQ